MEMEGVGESPPPPSSSGTPTPGQSSSTSPAKVKVTIGGIIPLPGMVGVGGCSETADTSVEGKSLKTDMNMTGEDAGVTPSSGVGKPVAETMGAEAEDGDDNEANGNGSGMPPVREQLHPLQNPVILAHLFERCPPELLAQCRLVSKHWLDLSLTSWRDTARLILRDDSLYDWSRPSGSLTIGKYLELVDKPENKWGMKPHRTMKLVSGKHDLNNNEQIQSFWNRVGRDLTSLELISCEFPRVEDLRGIIFGSCPNLKRLSVRDCKFQQSAPVQDFRELKYVEPSFGEQTNLRSLSLEIPVGGVPFNRLPIHWLELLSHFPSLTTLKVSIKRPYLPRTESVHEELFKAIETIKQKDAKKLCFRTFELDPWLRFLVDLGPHPDLSHFEGLQQLPLKSLEIEVGASDESNNHNPLLEDVLTRYRDTLSRITVSLERSHGYDYRRYPYSWGFPCNVELEKLEELRIHMLCTSMEFLKNTPKLKKLEFLDPRFGRSLCNEMRIFPELETSALLEVKLSHLTEFRMDYRMTSNDITTFARLMPNVTKLVLSLSDKLFCTVCQSWRNVKEMEALSEDLTDKGITGLDKGWERIAPADVTNLQNLETFKFWSQELTDRSVFQGFLKLPSFKLLHVCHGIMALGEMARKSLSEKGITFQGDYEYESEDPFWDGGHDCYSDTSMEEEPSYDYSYL